MPANERYKTIGFIRMGKTKKGGTFFPISFTEDAAAYFKVSDRGMLNLDKEKVAEVKADESKMLNLVVGRVVLDLEANAYKKRRDSSTAPTPKTFKKPVVEDDGMPF